MVYYRELPIDDAFFALAHPVRREILERLSKRDLSVAGVSEPLEVSPSAMTKHLHILERAGLLSRTKNGCVHRLHFEPEPLKKAADWLMKYQIFWSGNLDSLDNYLEQLTNIKKQDGNY